MQTQVIRHDGLERMIRAYRFFAALVQRLRDSCALNSRSVSSRQEQPATAA